MKTRSVCVSETRQKGQARYIKFWLAFAIGQQEIAKLKSEPHVEGDVSTMASPCGSLPDEAQLCMHPY